MGWVLMGLVANKRRLGVMLIRDLFLYTSDTFNVKGDLEGDY